jgi:hypothetical protein
MIFYAFRKVSDHARVMTRGYGIPVTEKTRRKNIALAGTLFAFIGGVYYYMLNEMRATV